MHNRNTHADNITFSAAAIRGQRNAATLDIDCCFDDKTVARKRGDAISQSHPHATDSALESIVRACGDGGAFNFACSAWIVIDARDHICELAVVKLMSSPTAVECLNA